MSRGTRRARLEAWGLAALIGMTPALATARSIGHSPGKDSPGEESSGENSKPSGATAHLGGLFPSRQERLARLERELAHELEVTLRAVPGVLRARVHLSLPRPAPLVGTAPPLPGKAIALVQHAGARPAWDEDQVRTLIAGAVQGLAPEQVQVLLRRAPEAAAVSTSPNARSPETRSPETHSPETGWVTVGPLVVERDSAGLLRLLLGAASVGGLLLVAVIVALWWRLRPLVRSSGP